MERKNRLPKCPLLHRFGKNILNERPPNAKISCVTSVVVVGASVVVVSSVVLAVLEDSVVDVRVVVDSSGVVVVAS